MDPATAFSYLRRDITCYVYDRQGQGLSIVIKSHKNLAKH